MPAAIELLELDSASALESTCATVEPAATIAPETFELGTDAHLILVDVVNL